MARTPLASRLQDALSESADQGLTRGKLLRRAGVAGAALAGLGRLAPPAEGAAAPSIAIVGAGLAGLSAAYSLQRAGLRADLYEASDRVGGRCWTIRGAFADSQIAEHGGELIDQGHTQVRQLAQALGLDLDNLAAAETNGTEMLGYFDGAPYTYDEATRDLKAVWQKVHSDL